MNVLVTGATGFVGSWLLADLVRSLPDARLFGTHYGPGGDLPRDVPADRVAIIECDMTDPGQVREAVSRSNPDLVFHLAGFASAGGAVDPAVVKRANVDAATLLLETLTKAGRPCRVQLASSGYVYGATDPARPAIESDPFHPFGIYAESKVEMEKAVSPFGSDLLQLTITRAFNHTGPRQAPAFVVPAFARQIARIEKGLEPPVVRVGNLEARRDFLDVRDVVRAYRLLLTDGEAVDIEPCRIVNVSSGTPVGIGSLLERLRSQSRVALSVETDPARMRPSDLPECVGSSARLTALTGWSPEVDLDRTLDETLDWWRASAEI